ncbi:CIA30 family protein [Loktanella sp. DJP18]|uniref:CIA30 family protein n=1 Tax=Loktanella sp. DJP18 TaxID=3409788 RepID=UPI003BB55B7B
MNLKWDYVADTVMGGVSRGHVEEVVIAGRTAMRLTGDVSLDNDGGFIQMAADLPPDHGAADFSGIEIDLFGNDEVYDLRLRTTDLTRPWQSFRTERLVSPGWSTYRVSFADLTPHRTQETFHRLHLRRIGVVAIGRRFHADVAVAGVRLYRGDETCAIAAGSSRLP